MESVPPRVFSPTDRPAPQVPRWTLWILGAFVATSRLTSKAGPGEVLVSETTGGSLGGQVPSERLEPVQVKGKAEPVIPFRVFPVGASAATKSA